MTFKALTHCCNGDGRPVQPPSKVLCKECLTALSAKFDQLRETLGAPGAQKEESNG